MRLQSHHSALIISSVVTVSAFVGATTYTQNRLARLDALSATIETNAVPSIEDLSRAAVRLTRLNQLLEDAAGGEPRRTEALADARAELTGLEGDIGTYLQLPTLPGERDYWAALRRDVTRAEQMVRTAIDASDGSAAPPIDYQATDTALDHAVRSVLASLEFDVRRSERLAGDVKTVRVSTLRTTIVLDLVATLFALGGVVIAYRASRRHDRLQTEHAALLAARVTELDRFAGRVAHDILSPLGTIAAGLALVARSSDPRARTYIERSEHALQRVQQLVEALLLFARSGAVPDPKARCSLDAVLASVVADCADRAAEDGIDLAIDAERALEVRCSAGVMVSIVENLVRNAIKYMGAQPRRRVVVRAHGAHAEASVVRLEVEDTGPGIPRDLQGEIFEPFVRGPHADVNGTGLGLATAKRLVESHGGAIGVRSTPGSGSVFWIELPLVATSAAAPQPEPEPHHVSS